MRCSQQTSQILKRPLTAFMKAAVRQSQETAGTVSRPFGLTTDGFGEFNNSKLN